MSDAREALEALLNDLSVLRFMRDKQPHSKVEQDALDTAIAALDERDRLKDLVRRYVNIIDEGLMVVPLTLDAVNEQARALLGQEESES